MTYEDTYFLVSGTSKDGGNLCDEGSIPCSPCDGGMTELTIKYLGDTPNATIKVYKDKVQPNKLLAEFNGKNQGDEFSFTGTGPHNHMGAKIRITINGNNGNYTEIHTSCSQPIAAGMIFDNLYEIMGGMSKHGGPLCEEGEIPCSPCDGGMTALTLQYLGDTPNATIKVYKDKVEPNKLLASFDGKNYGDEFSFTGTGPHNHMGAKIRITINGSNCNYTEIHTSCSQPIGVGMLFDNTYLVVDGTSKHGGPLCEEGNTPPPECGPCDGGMTALTLQYLGDIPGATIKVYKDKVEPNKLLASFDGKSYGDEFSFTGTGPHNHMGAKIRITINGNNGNYTEIHTSCSQTIGVGMLFNNTYLVVAGTSKHGGPLCEETGGGGNPDCGPCDGQMTSLTIEYLGTESNATVKVYKDKVEPNKLIKTFNNVNMGDILSFTGTGPDNKIGAKARLTINGDNGNYIEIHTSCSQPIEVGMIYESTYLLLAGTSKNGGPLCDDN